MAWFRTERTLSIHSICSLRRELFYWAAVLATFALGTSTGDMTAYTLHLGFLASGFLFAGIFLVPVIAYRFAGMNAIVAFWFAYILTRPLGASFADWLGVPHSLGGLDLGRAAVAVGLTIAIVIVVACLSITRVDVGPEPASEHH